MKNCVKFIQIINDRRDIMNRIVFLSIFVTLLFCQFLDAEVFAASDEAIKKELKKRIYVSGMAYENLDYKKYQKESAELEKFILESRGKAVPALIEIMNDKKEETWLRNRAMGILGAQKVKEATDHIAKYLSDTEGNKDLLSGSIRALSNIGDEKSIKYLIDYYKAFLRGLNKGQERSFVIKELTKSKSKEVVELFIKALSDKDKYVRLFAVEALGEWKAKKAGPQIKKLLKTENSPEVIAASNKSLNKIYSGGKEKEQ